MARHDDHLADDLAGEALGALVPLAGPLGSRAMQAARAEWARLTSDALRAAERQSNLSREDLAEWVQRDPRAVPLYLKVLWAAGTNGHDETLRAMGTVLGEAARATAAGEEAGWDRADLALRALGDLGPMHFRVLAVLDRSVRVATEAGDNLTQFTPGYVAEQTGLSLDVTSQCLMNLANCGLTQLTSAYGDNAFPLTYLGRAVLRAAQHLD